MKIFYDHLIFSLQQYGGVSKYFAKLLKNMPDSSYVCPILFSDNAYLAADGVKQRDILLPPFNKGRIRVGLGYPYTILKSLTTEFDIYHQTNFNDFLFPFIKRKKMITTFHDTNLLTFPPKGFWLKDLVKQQQKALNRATKIIAISHNTKSDILQHFNIPEEKIEVIHHGVDKNKIPNLSESRIIAEPYILYVGGRNQFKNFERFIHAFQIVSTHNKDLRLICTGHAFSESEEKILLSLQILDKVVQISADESAMARLYRDAEMFVYPSLYEGFGMPILEAMVYDCPVVLSNTSCFPEIAENAGVYFDPNKIEDMAEKILSVLSNSVLKNKMITLGQERLKQFSWEKCTQEHINIYQTLI